MTGQYQTIPVRIYDREKHIVLAAPLPGLEAENISVVIGGSRVVHLLSEIVGNGPR